MRHRTGTSVFFSGEHFEYEDCEHFLCFLLAFVESVSVSQFQLEVCGEIMKATSKFGHLPLFQLKASALHLNF